MQYTTGAPTTTNGPWKLDTSSRTRATMKLIFLYFSQRFFFFLLDWHLPSFPICRLPTLMHILSSFFYSPSSQTTNENVLTNNHPPPSVVVASFTQLLFFLLLNSIPLSRAHNIPRVHHFQLFLLPKFSQQVSQLPGVGSISNSFGVLEVEQRKVEGSW